MNEANVLRASLFRRPAPLLSGVHVQPPNELIAHPDVVRLDLAAASRDSALIALHAGFAGTPGVLDAAQLLKDILERAQISSVCIATDVALPHARTAAVDRLVLAVGRVAEPGVNFDEDHPQVRLMFMIGTPRQQVEDYLRLVAAISRLLRRPGTRSALIAAPTEEAFRALLGRGATP